MSAKRSCIVPRIANHDIVPPLVSSDCTVLLLGSMLSPRSAEQRFYYAHPQNRFWRVIYSLFGESDPKDNDARARFALDKGIALWDVLHSCTINGAADRTIRDEVYNDIAGLLNDHPSIKRVYTTGKKAFAMLNEYNRSVCHPILSAAICLPSTSPQNFTFSFAQLKNAYSILLQD